MFSFEEFTTMVVHQFILAAGHFALGVLNTALPSHKNWDGKGHGY